MQADESAPDFHEGRQHTIKRRPMSEAVADKKSTKYIDPKRPLSSPLSLLFLSSLSLSLLTRYPH